MLKDLKIENGDFVEDGNGSWVELTGSDAVSQQINHLMKLFLGEFFLEPGEGIDWRKISEKPLSVEAVKDAIIAALRREPAIESIDNFKMEPDTETRKFIVTWAVTIGGTRVSGTGAF